MSRLTLFDRFAITSCGLLLLAQASFILRRPIFPPHWAPWSIWNAPSLHKISKLSRQPASEGTLTWAHSHNDYEQSRPLHDALDNRAGSIEVDVFLHEGQLQVSHLGYFFTGTLKDLYLDPLQERVNKLGSVYGDARPLLLWIDIKDSNPELLGSLHELLAQYPMFTRFTDQGIESRQVTTVLTGIGEMKSAYVEKFSLRFACRDHGYLDTTDPSAADTRNRWLWYAFDWFHEFRWNGTGAMPDAELSRLRELVLVAHAKGRQVRIWGNPDTPEAWKLLYEAGVDLVGTDFPEGLRLFYESGEMKLPQAVKGTSQ